MQGFDGFDIVPRRMVWLVALATVIWTLVMVLLAGQRFAVYHLILLGVGAALWQGRGPVSAGLRRLPVPALLRMGLLGYLGVVAEETLVGVLYASTDGAGVGLRVGQFISFNLFAFTGIIWGLAIGRRLLALGRHDLFLIAGGWGLFAEGVYRWVFVQPLAGSLLILPTMMVYAVILWPAQASVGPEGSGTRVWPLPLRLVAVWALAFVLSLPPMAMLNHLRTTQPAAFPPCDYIAC
jgi:hypothetical protein